ncbi:MAG: hypothetical protein LBR20_02210 [Propionibacteriaceae bacterium]|jgi:hypothetical protein|nr:hypothetical protein [Propionibacteriaceae bacterium]
MAWLKTDDDWCFHPKVIPLSLSARGVWFSCATYCAKKASDYITLPEIRIACGGTVSKRLIQELVDAGLWEARTAGFSFHDWYDYQPSKDQQEQRRERDRRRKQ